MRFIMMPVIFTVGFLAYEHHDQMMDLYRAAYPSDPAKAAALDSCAERQNFNRLDSGDRASCYAGTYGRQAPPVLVPTPQPVYPFNPSHLPGSDIRRQEANAAYLEGTAGSPHPPNPPRPVQHPTLPHPYRFDPRHPDPNR